MSRQVRETLASFPWGGCASNGVRASLTFWIVCGLFSKGASSGALAHNLVDMGFAKLPVVEVETVLNELLPKLATLKQRRQIIRGGDEAWRAVLSA